MNIFDFEKLDKLILSEDEYYMAKALELAKLGEGRVSPNPMVGAVVVKDKRILSIGYHMGPGTKHAERMALDNMPPGVEGATLYVNLEPCVHYGRTPPCAPYIVEKKIKEVVIGCVDPDERVNGKGIGYLKKNNVKIKVGVLKEKCEEINRFYLTYKIKKRPYITLKYAMTMDGKIALKGGVSKWISSEEEREFVHYLRGNYDAILIGKGTFLKDNPKLTPRSVFSFRTPFRFIIWGKDKFEHFESDFFKIEKGFLVVSEDYKGKESDFVIKIKGKNRVDLANFVKKLYEMNIISLLVEGGSTILSSFLKENLFDEIHISCSGKIAGDGLSPLRDLELNKFLEGFEIKFYKVFKSDIYMVWRKNENQA
ncbi:MAG: bifunctional diaminohydroxyphosphoribosylaminopyrimidine deaminase/5-amino-6-(5-phosphoribosylamino)uracil reductase RibD [Candidatus Hydrothermales bacterium]